MRSDEPAPVGGTTAAGASTRAVTGEREKNLARVLRLILEHRTLTRSQLARLSGLSHAGASRLVEALIGAGLVVETKPIGRPQRGRPAPPLSCSPELGHVVGIDMGISTTRLLARDLTGTEIGRHETETPGHLPSAELGVWLHECFTELCESHGIDPEATRQVSVAVPAKVDEERILIRPAPTVAHLAGDDLFREFQSRVPAPVTFAQDAQMALQGERLPGGAAADAASAVLVISSSGVGAAAMTDGRIMPGHGGALGEIGSFPLGPDSAVRNGMSLHGLGHLAEERGIVFASRADLLDTSSPELRELHLETRKALIAALSAITLCFDPEVIILTGRMLPLLATLIDDVSAELIERLPRLPEIRLVTAEEFLATRGCAEHALTVVHEALVEDVRSGRIAC